MAKSKVSQDKAKQIAAWREEGLSDAQIVARHGSDDLSAGYRWLEENPGADPRGEKASAAPRPARGGGALGDLPAPALLI